MSNLCISRKLPFSDCKDEFQMAPTAPNGINVETAICTAVFACVRANTSIYLHVQRTSCTNISKYFGRKRV